MATEHKLGLCIQILTEYCSGSSLAVYLRRKQNLPLELLRSYTEGMLQGLQYLHSKTVVHKHFRVSISCKSVNHFSHVFCQDFGFFRVVSFLCFFVVLFYIFFSGGHLLVTMHFLGVDASVQMCIVTFYCENLQSKLM